MYLYFPNLKPRLCCDSGHALVSRSQTRVCEKRATSRGTIHDSDSPGERRRQEAMFLALPCRRVTRTAHDSTRREHVRTLRRRRQLCRAVPLLPRQLHRQSACPAVAIRARRFENATPPDASSGADPRAHRRSRTPPLPQPQLENGDKGAPRPPQTPGTAFPSTRRHAAPGRGHRAEPRSWPSKCRARFSPD